EKDSVIATIPIGYADGYSRRLSGRASVLIHRRRAPIVGRICMDTCMADVSAVDDRPVTAGDEVILFGPVSGGSGADLITVDEVADWLDTINYEVTCLIGRRVPRAYLRDGSVCQIQNYLLPRD
ncbi:MAG: alanine racemase C-terminal domain-containing protein, partial [Bacillota bacterium]|nr:alanine racemase C-terminal domain-containing protein [Bacillota bacterium]